MKEHTTPLEREILTHYWTRPTPYAGGSENWSTVTCEAIAKFIAAGILERVNDPDDLRHEAIQANQIPMKLYMQALAAVPLPVRHWVIPRESGELLLWEEQS